MTVRVFLQTKGNACISCLQKIFIGVGAESLPWLHKIWLLRRSLGRCLLTGASCRYSCRVVGIFATWPSSKVCSPTECGHASGTLMSSQLHWKPLSISDPILFHLSHWWGLSSWTCRQLPAPCIFTCLFCLHRVGGSGGNRVGRALATRMEDWASLGQHKRKPEIPFVTRESRRIHLLMQETWVLFLGQEDPLGEGNGSPHFSILAWEIPWTVKPGGLQSTVCKTVRHDLAPKQTNKKIYI